MGIGRQTWTDSGKLEQGTSPNVLMPNVVRIEQLSSKAKERFLTGKMAVINKVGAGIFTNAQESIKAASEGQKNTVNKNISFYESFYGFLHKDNVIDIGISPKWGGDQTKTDKAFSNFTNILKIIPKIPLGPLGTLSPGEFVINTLDSIKSFVDTSNDLIGLSNTSTGGVTIRDFSGVDLSNFSVKCAWYVPEQEDLAIDGITTIMRMAYPKPVPSQRPGWTLSDAIYKSTKGILGMYKPLQAPVNKTLDALPVPVLGGIVKLLTDLAFAGLPDPDYDAPVEKDSFLAKTVELIYKISEVGGQVTTINPFPVRLTIGHILDIEPLIITSVKVIMSQETFINDKGLHLPIFIEVDISMKYWLNPTPENDFMSIAGTEMYGYTVTQPSES